LLDASELARGQKPRFLPAADRSGALIPLKAPQATLLGPSWASALRARRALTRSASKIAPGDFVSQSIELLCLEPIVAHELQQAAGADQVQGPDDDEVVVFVVQEFLDLRHPAPVALRHERAVERRE